MASAAMNEKDIISKHIIKQIAMDIALYLLRDKRIKTLLLNYVDNRSSQPRMLIFKAATIANGANIIANTSSAANKAK